MSTNVLGSLPPLSPEQEKVLRARDDNYYNAGKFRGRELVSLWILDEAGKAFTRGDDERAQSLRLLSSQVLREVSLEK